MYVGVVTKIEDRKRKKRSVSNRMKRVWQCRTRPRDILGRVLKGFNGVKHSGAYLILRLGLDHGGDASLEGLHFILWPVKRAKMCNKSVGAHGNEAGLQ
jgi:hypothetical protein